MLCLVEELDTFLFPRKTWKTNDKLASEKISVSTFSGVSSSPTPKSSWKIFTSWIHVYTNKYLSGIHFV